MDLAAYMPFNNSPRVSILMAVHGNGEWLGQAIDSVIGQSFQEWELICVLDVVTESVNRLIDEKMGDSRISVVRLHQSVGAASARNIGLKKARGPLIAILDSDDEWATQHLEISVGYLEEHTNSVLVGTRYQPIDETGIKLGKAVKVPTRWLSAKLVFANCFAHSTVVFRSKFALETGGYPDGISMGEDYCLWLKLAKFGDVSNLKSVTVNYRRHPNQTTKKSFGQGNSNEILQHKLELAGQLRIPLWLVKIGDEFWRKYQRSKQF